MTTSPPTTGIAADRLPEALAETVKSNTSLEDLPALQAAADDLLTLDAAS